MTTDPDFMTSLARGLAVLRQFEQHQTLTASQAATHTGLSRAAARRCLHTLEQLGYVAAAEGGSWRLLPALLPLARAFLRTTLADAAQPLLVELRDKLGESCSVGVLAGDDVIYIARAEARRIVGVALSVGSRLPAYCTSMGRVLLASLPDSELEAYLAKTSFARRTPYTLADPGLLGDAIRRCRADGFAVIDEELEVGLRSIAAPIRSRSGRVVAAINLGAPSSRISAETLRADILPALSRCAVAIGAQAE